MIIGEAPGREEELQGEPFVGSSGKLLNTALEEIGRSREEFYITNVYKKRPPDNRDPTEEELESHKELLDAEFESVKPEIILVLGKVARNVLLPELEDQTMALTARIWWELWDGGPHCLVAYHPAYILYNRGNTKLYTDWVDDIRIFAYE